MKISVVVTSLKSSTYLLEQLESINNQSYKIYELVIVFDFCNQKANININNLKKLMNNISKLKILENDTNIGPHNSIKKGINNTNGDLIFFSDHDDIWNLNKIEICVNHFVKYKPKLIYHNALILGSDIVFQDGDLVHNSNPLSQNIFKVIQSNKLVGAFFAIDGILVRDIVSIISLSPMHDWIIYLIIVFNRYKVIYINDPLQVYRRHPKTYTGRNKNIFKKIYSIFIFRIMLIYNLIKFNVLK